jgi:cell fate regulator YaaT (PSP1 superfamily)
VAELIEVAFKGNRREFFTWDDVAPAPGAPTAVVVEGDRGEDLGRVHATGERAELRFRGVPHGAPLGPPTRRALRVATADEVRRAAALAEENETARRGAMAAARTHRLPMKITDADWQWDRRKLTLYFTAEKRVDFRALVRELASTFRTRIELKQIGVRDEAKRLDGIGRCGRQFCSAAWLPELRPVNLGVAKDQRLSLNPMQISGACGRLMCCLRYEHDFYVQSRRRFPKEGRLVVTARGEEKVIATDIFRDRVTLRGADGEVHVVPLAELVVDGTEWRSTAAEPETPRDGLEEDALDEAPRRLPVLPAAPTTPGRGTGRPTGPRPRPEPATGATGPQRPADAPSSPPQPPARDAVPPALATVPAPAPPRSAEATDDDELDGDEDDGPDDGAAEGTDASGAPRKRRRRGRRGGRRNRARQQGQAGEPGDTPADTPPSE